MPAPPDSPHRKTVIAWCLGVGVAAILGAVITTTHLSAHSAFDDALVAVEGSALAASDASAALSEQAETTARAVERAGVIIEFARDDLIDAAARDAFGDAVTTASGAADTAARAAEGVTAVDGEKPLWTWELFAAVPLFDEAAAAHDAHVVSMRSAGEDLERADAAMTESALALYATAAPAAAAVEAAHVSARPMTVIDFRLARDAVAIQKHVGPGAVQAFTTYATAADNLKASARSELAEKAGPRYEARLEIEAFARSISGGVLLDFDWAPIVNGLGGPDWISGLASWNAASGGFATITLSDSVADWWPNAESRALVAHEVGHAISAKCPDLYDWNDATAAEAWATAWAISMGHTATANGVEAYGYPPQELIELAAACR